MALTNTDRSVVKLGGSLLELADWPDRLRRWLDRRRTHQQVLVVGGGPEVDALREAQQQTQLDETTAHWMCIAAMAVNARTVAATLDAPIITAMQLRAAAPRTGVGVIDPWQFLWHEEPTLVEAPLPASWDVTSDSIAARLSDVLGLDELALLKSSAPKPTWTKADAAAANYVDRYFPQAARNLRVRCVDLRSIDFAQQWLGQ
jgi:aspartokinase-like uncharacterized kinase